MWLPIDDSHDWLRLFIAVICTVCVVLLLAKFKRGRNIWNPKTKDYWYSLLMWCLAGAALAMEGIYRDSNWGARLIFVTAAGVVSLKGLLRSGEWGEHR